MAAYFFDSSALAKRFIRETGTAFVLSLWRPSAHHAIYAARLDGMRNLSNTPGIANEFARAMQLSWYLAIRNRSTQVRPTQQSA